MLNNSQSNSQSFNDSELSKGFHLLTDSSDTITVNTAPVAPDKAHLYPRLVGSNWTSYLSQSKIILGRSGTLPRTTRQKQLQVDIDFGSSKAISRKHCEIRYSVRRDRWELHVYGRNGIKLNQVAKKPRDKPNVLKTGALIEICNTRCVFILPDNYIKPSINEECVDVNTPSEVEELGFDVDLEAAMIQAFNNHNELGTAEILQQVQKDYIKSVEKDHVLQILVLSPKFRLVSNPISTSSKESDSAKWVLIPKATEHDEPSDISVSTPTNEKRKGLLSSLDSTDNMSISTPIAHDTMEFSVRSYSQCDAMSISNSTHDLNAEQLQQPNNNELPSTLTSNTSFSKYFNMDEGWSFSMPDISSSPLNEEQKEPLQPEPSPSSPVPFQS
ncbi:hypothetical protein BD770DRAFT_415374, partial [Pilaira anomala]